MSSLDTKIKHFENLGYSVLNFQTYKSMLNQIGYDINITYTQKWATVNSWEGENYYATKCFYLGTNIAYCNIAGDSLKNESNSNSLKNLRLNYCFYFGENIYIV